MVPLASSGPVIIAGVVALAVLLMVYLLKLEDQEADREELEQQAALAQAESPDAVD